MNMRIFCIDIDGHIDEFLLDSDRLQLAIDKVRASLSDKYFAIEEKVKRDFYGSSYRSVFVRNSVNLSFLDLPVENIGKLEDYEYYEHIIFDDNFQIYNSFKARIDNNWQFKYIINDCAERMPVVLMNKIKPLVLSRK